MNNYTITLYKDDDYHNVEHTYKLGETKLSIEKNNFCCFSLSDGINENMVCGYDKFCGNSATNDWAIGWNKDFALFKNACRTGIYTLLTGMDEDNLKKALKKKISDGNAENARKRAKNIKENMLKSDKNNNPIKEAHEEGFKALQRELNLEKLIKREEKEREKLMLVAFS